jgi:hypothetical protein
MRFLFALLLICPVMAKDVGLQVTLDVSEAPQLKAWGEEAKALLEVWSPRLENLLLSEGAVSTPPITLRIKKADKGVGATSGTTISIVSSWIEKHPEDFGLAIHELVHVIQAYPNAEPWWVTEGIADYLRWGIFEGKALAAFPRPKVAQGYQKGYQVAGGFLLWLEAGPAPGIVKRLNTAMRKGQYKATLFEEMTGRPLDQLWDAYVGRD